MSIERFRNLEDMNDSIAELSISMERIQDEDPVIFDPEREVDHSVWKRMREIYDGYLNIGEPMLAAKCAADMKVVRPLNASIPVGEREILQFAGREWMQMLTKLEDLARSGQFKEFCKLARYMRSGMENPELLDQELVNQSYQDWENRAWEEGSNNNYAIFGLVNLDGIVLFPGKHRYQPGDDTWQDILNQVSSPDSERIKNDLERDVMYRLFLVEAKLLFPERFSEISIPIDIEFHWADLWQRYKDDPMPLGSDFARLARDLAVIYAKKAEMTPGGIVIDNSPAFVEATEPDAELPPRLKFDQ